jgi:hypothetical protein
VKVLLLADRFLGACPMSENERIAARVHTLIGEAYIALGQLTTAREWFAEAGQSLPREALIAYGEDRLKQGSYMGAREVFAEVGHTPIPEKLIACGEVALTKNWILDAYGAFTEAGHKSGLITCCEIFSERSEAQLRETARRTFVEMGHIPGLLGLGRSCLFKGRLDEAHNVFAEVARLETVTK